MKATEHCKYKREAGPKRRKNKNKEIHSVQFCENCLKNASVYFSMVNRYVAAPDSMQ